MNTVNTSTRPCSFPPQIVMVIFGCVEMLMGFQMAGEDMKTSYSIYIPFWLGALVCHTWSFK